LAGKLSWHVPCFLRAPCGQDEFQASAKRSAHDRAVRGVGAARHLDGVIAMSLSHARVACALCPFVACLLAAACGASEWGSTESANLGNPPATGGMGGAGGSTGATDAGVDAPPEEELESTFQAPVATGRYVWTANPASGRVAYIDATTLQVQVVEAGNAPTFLAALPDANEDVAIVLNVLSRDATVLRARSDGTLSTFSLPVPAAGNAWAVSAQGRWATAWTDARAVDSPDALDGYQDIAVLDLAAGSERSTSLTVGYRPMALGYDDQGTRLFAVTEDGVSVVALDGAEPTMIKNVALSDDPLEDPRTRDVSITRDGGYALVRREGQAVLSVLSLSDDTRVDVTLPGAVTDLDLSPDGTVAAAVIRDTGQVALLPVPQIVATPAAFTLVQIEGTVVGSISFAAASPVGILYTNALPSEVLTALDTSEPAPVPRSILLHAAVEAVFPTPEAGHAIVLHHELSQGSSYPAAMSVVPVASELPSKIVGLDAPAVSVAIGPDGADALVAVGDELHPAFGLVVAHMPSLQIDRYELASRPIAAGIVGGAHQGYVAQQHPDGRITFVSFETGEVRTLTGFELASQVVNGSKP
jgi:DNA-binding beta-propeller fold protein YncE